MIGEEIMDFGFSKDQELIRKSVREFLKKECPSDRVRELAVDTLGYDPNVWQKMSDLGYLGLAIPESYEGMGGEYLELMIFMEEVGRKLLPSPFFATVALCAMPIARFGSAEQKQRILPKIVEGQVWTMALLEAAADYDPKNIQMSARKEGSGYVLNGTKLFVPFANAAENILVVARSQKESQASQGISVLLVGADAPGIQKTLIPTGAGNQQYEVIFEDVMVADTDILGQSEKGWEIVEYILQYATVLKCAEMSGGAQTVLEITRNYAAKRVQFGKPIGSLQAIQHKLANDFIWVEGLKNLVYEAASHLNFDNPCKGLVSMTKLKANTVYEQVCIDGITIHGAIGFTEEMDVGLYHLRTKSMEFDLGGSEFHRERIIRELERQVPPFLEP